MVYYYTAGSSEIWDEEMCGNHVKYQTGIIEIHSKENMSVCVR
jgi:hypothetical protein